MAIPEWQLPPGVAAGTHDYAQSTAMADDYDDYHAENPLFTFEEQVLVEELQPLGLVADLGCGTGRALLPLIRQGHSGLAVDLSEEMLRVVRQKAADEGFAVQTLQANLVELDALPDESVDHSICLFSTLGMIRGREHRRTALKHFHRILKPGGKLVLHVHNFWFNVWDGPSEWGGPLWVARNLVRPFRKGDLEIGDKFFPYRGVPNFFLHVFRSGELRQDVASAGFRLHRWIPLNVHRRHALRFPWLLPNLRANGWIVVGRKP